MFGVMQHLDIQVCENVADAIEKGFDYSQSGDYTAVTITKAVVVKNGTGSGKPTVDFILQDQAGNKFVVMITGALIRSIPCGEEV